MKRDFLCVSDIAAEEFIKLLDRADELKHGKDAAKCPLIGKSIGLIFEKPSTRTRVSFEVGIYQLGGQPVYLNPKEIQIGRGESVADTARVLSRYLSGIVLRAKSHVTIREFASFSSVPVINGLSDIHHPCQAVADMMTVLERKGHLDGIRFAFIGDGNNVSNSLIEAASLLGISFVIACPEGYEPDRDIVDRALKRDGFRFEIVRNPEDAASGADVLYTDVWVSMGQEEESDERKNIFGSYRIDKRMVSCAAPDVTVLHCLPAKRGLEITDEVMDGPHSAVFDQAENRLHTEKAILEFLLA